MRRNSRATDAGFHDNSRMSRPAPASLTRLEEIVGSAHAFTDPSELAARQVDARRPSAVLQPADAAQVAEIIRFAAAEKLALIPCGGCTKLGIGLPPVRYDIALDLSRMNRLLAYDPHDLTLGVEPGVPIEELLRVLEFVTGEGVISKGGGRVVKNVTGYDLHKLLIGSLGTLAVITRVNFRTFPLPPAQGTFVASFSDAESAFGFCRAIAQSVLTPQILEVADPGAAHLVFSAETPARITPQQWSVVITAAGQPSVVDRYARELGHMASAANAAELVPLSDAEHSSALGRISEFPRLVLDAVPSATIFRIGVLPTAMPSLLKNLSEIAKRSHLDLATLTRASGIVYSAFFGKEGRETSSATMASAAKEVFHICSLPENGAQAMLEWCQSEVKRAVGDVWGPLRQDFELMHRVKSVFDPQNVLSPGRFAGGI
jgi:glycolate oxidase FAD binding subunit